MKTQEELLYLFMDKFYKDLDYEINIYLNMINFYYNKQPYFYYDISRKDFSLFTKPFHELSKYFPDVIYLSYVINKWGHDRFGESILGVK